VRSKKKKLSQQDLRAMGVTPGLMAHRVGPDGRARLEQLSSEASRGRPSLFLRSAPNECSPPKSEGGHDGS
jgi:hypothetical protein